jgi:hypothetical protein
VFREAAGAGPVALSNYLDMFQCTLAPSTVLFFRVGKALTAIAIALYLGKELPFGVQFVLFWCCVLGGAMAFGWI